MTWGNKVTIPEIEIDLPHDIHQVPDVFIYLYTETTFPFKYKEKLGFLRIPAKELLTKEPEQLTWKPLTSIESAKKTVGLLLMNAQLVPDKGGKAPKPKRKPFPRGQEIQHYFFC